MAKKKDERFVKVHEEGTGFGWLRTVWVDKQTGVNYLFVNSGYAGGNDLCLDIVKVKDLRNRLDQVDARLGNIVQTA